ncbi:MAG: ANTAR domain-containing protein [Bacteroides sp.]|nr:ANTAR domain-containing protein [Bacteroides sp.]
MRRILIAGKNKKICESISALLTDAGSAEVPEKAPKAAGGSACVSDADAKDSKNGCRTVCVTDGIHARSVDVFSFDLIVISTPLEDEFGLDLAAELHGKSGAGLIVITKGELAEEVQNKIKFTGAFVIGRPTSKTALLQAARFAEIAGESVKRLTEEKNRLERQIEDMRIINRAKSCLMQYLKLTEEQAHRHIQKQAMDLRKTQRQAAEDILLTYDI